MCNVVSEVVDEIRIRVIGYHDSSCTPDSRYQAGKSGTCSQLENVAVRDILLCMVLQIVGYSTSGIP
jgi:hypothetical protein